MQTETDSAGTVSQEAVSQETDNSDRLGTRSELEVVDACKRRLKASVPVEKVKEELDRNYKELAANVQLPGFRKGKIPRRLLEARFGKEIEADVKEALLSVSIGELVEDHKLDVVGAPKVAEVDFAPDKDLSFVVELEVRPHFDLPQYKGLEVQRELVQVKDEDVEERITAMRRKGARLVQVDPAEARSDDVYIGKYNLYSEGTKVKSGVSASFTPSSKALHRFYVEDLEERIKAWKPEVGSTLKVAVHAPADFPDEVLRNKDLELELTLEDTRRAELPELNEEFLTTLEVTSADELRSNVRKSLEESSQRESDRKIEAKIVEKLVNDTQIALPQGLVQSILTRRRLEREYELLEKGMPPEEVQATLVREWGAAGGDGPQDGAASEVVLRDMKEFFILEKIASDERIFATEEEVDKRIYLMARLYGISIPALREELRSSGKLEELRLSLRNEKVRNFLKKEARILGADGQPEVAASDAPTPS